ncbi:hypothetical protein BABINDRAFT_56069 [Babjeviella inositovora NRRL Y-12698]|uniref:DnaJ homolog 1, mitochondrial n=1 Tax=Babjeviella inositovora NRRL Y-12698 TaxID=984486 RepID=A0A1E3QZC1_9ASCO|nr:uncharacterized protein BABINDRAFT_56069 [Babjeviella inositovora NRRL Y-12698]ODQ82437.1 hypothetical protein BABINDRAFT_56069 [Babjeviella inositovora NRRL Y-12698]
MVLSTISIACGNHLGLRLSSALGSRLACRSFHVSHRSLLDDPYKTLGVGSSSSTSDIKKAYYKLAKQFHPDVNKEEGAEKKFHDIQGAYEILSDADKKAQYDQFGPSAFSENGGQGFGQGGFHNGNPFAGQGGDPFAGFGNINFEDIFGAAFGQGGRGRAGPTVANYVGDNIEILKTISFKESIFGTKLKIDYNALDECHTCDGSGLKTGKKKTTCPSCNGTGQAVHYVAGGFQMASTCRTCQGLGVHIPKKDACGDCHGHGVTDGGKSTSIDLPCGLSDGTKLRVPGEGDAPNVTKGPNVKVSKGDLIIRIRVNPHKEFTRDGDSIIYKAEIPMTTAALGGQITVPTIDDKSVKMKIPAGTQHGRIITMPGQGVPINRNINNRGDMKIVVSVKTLRPETATQTALLEALADAFNDPSAKKLDPNWKAESDEPVDHPSKLKRIEDFLSGTFKKLTDKKE